MNNKLLLINAITYLYRESQMEDPPSRPVEILNEVCTSVKGPDIDVSVDREGKMINELKTLTLEMINSPPGTDYTLSELLQKIQIICDPDPTLFEAFRDNIIIDLDNSELKKSCLRILANFKKYFREKEVKSIINKYATIARFRPEEIGDISKFLTEMSAELEPYRTLDDTKDPAVVAEVDFSDRDTVIDAFNKVQESRSGDTILKTGWQKLNKMLNGGVRLGETIVVGALQHNNKSGFTRNLFKHFALYNAPHLYNENKKPLLLHVSFEDEIETTMEYFYKNIKENETLQEVTPDEIRNKSTAELADYVISRLQVNGFSIRFMRVNPSDWTYLDLQNKMIALESDGYEIKALVCDYLAMMPTTGCVQGPNGVDIRDMFRRLRNFTSARKIAFITPHQLSTEAKLLVRDEALDFVKRIANGGYYSGSRQIDQEVDTEIYLHIEKQDGLSYQTVQRGKRRGVDITPDKDKYFILPFREIGGLRDDINTEDSSVERIGMVNDSQAAEGKKGSFTVAPVKNTTTVTDMATIASGGYEGDESMF